MDDKTIREMLNQKPFEPFEILMSNGDLYLVKHPECLLIAKAKVVVLEEITDRLNILAMSHINELRPVGPQQSA